MNTTQYNDQIAEDQLTSKSIGDYDGLMEDSWGENQWDTSNISNRWDIPANVEGIGQSLESRAILNDSNASSSIFSTRRAARMNIENANNMAGSVPAPKMYPTSDAGMGMGVDVGYPDNFESINSLRRSFSLGSLANGNPEFDFDRINNLSLGSSVDDSIVGGAYRRDSFGFPGIDAYESVGKNRNANAHNNHDAVNNPSNIPLGFRLQQQQFEDSLMGDGEAPSTSVVSKTQRQQQLRQILQLAGNVDDEPAQQLVPLRHKTIPFNVNGERSSSVVPVPENIVRPMSRYLNAPSPDVISMETDQVSNGSHKKLNKKKDESNAITRPRVKVDHSYVDYCLTPDAKITSMESIKPYGTPMQECLDLLPDVPPFTERVSPQIPKRSGKVCFTLTLMRILLHTELSDIISWLSHGRAFIVRDMERFVDEVMPRFFKLTQFKSFIRQLSLWGFKRITKGPDSGSYYNQLFLRGKPKLAILMKCEKVKGTGVKLAPNPDDEPNFYLLEKKRPLPLLGPTSMSLPAYPGDESSVEATGSVQSMNNNFGSDYGHSYGRRSSAPPDCSGRRNRTGIPFQIRPPPFMKNRFLSSPRQLSNEERARVLAAYRRRDSSSDFNEPMTSDRSELLFSGIEPMASIDIYKAAMEGNTCRRVSADTADSGESYLNNSNSLYYQGTNQSDGSMTSMDNIVHRRSIIAGQHAAIMSGNPRRISADTVLSFQQQQRRRALMEIHSDEFGDSAYV